MLFAFFSLYELYCNAVGRPLPQQRNTEYINAWPPPLKIFNAAHQQIHLQTNPPLSQLIQPTPKHQATMYAKTLALFALALGVSATYQPEPPSSDWQETAPPAPPAKQPAPPTTYVYATFQGANPPVAQFEASIPADGSDYPISNPLSISHIITDSGPCTFYGVDGLVLQKPSGGLVDVGPPQTIVKAVCYPSGPPAQGGYKAKRFSA